jgi:FkbM family methyltransferase
MTTQLRSQSDFTDTRNGRIEFFAQDDPIGRSLAEYGEWAELEIQTLCGFIGLGSHVVDVGANIGTHAMAFARRVGATGSVIAFEPQRSVFEVLERNLIANGCTNVRAVNAGVGSNAGEMMVPAVDYQTHTNVGGVQLLPRAECKNGERVDILALDGYQLSACHLVKIDAEGMDADVITGMRATIDRLRPAIAVECSNVETGAAILQIKWTGYKVFLVLTVAFNPANFNRNSHNFFGVAHESSLLFVPEEILDHVPPSKPGAELIPIAGLDDLAVALLETPRFGDETSYDRKPAQLRELLGKIRAESTDQLRKLDSELNSARESAARESTRLEFRAASLISQVRRAEERLEHLSELQSALAACDQKRRELERQVHDLHNSTSWRLTAPLRKLKTAVSRA